MSNAPENMTSDSNIIQKQWLSTKAAAQQVVSYERRFFPGYKHLKLACHAAFPSIITPEILNLIHINFLDDENIPWIAETDFLLSPLCRSIDENVFEVEPRIREVLLIELERQFGWQRPLELAYFLRSYLHERPERKQSAHITQTHHWIAESYIRPDAVIEKLTELLEKTVPLEGNALTLSSNQLQFHSIVEIAKAPLKRANSQNAYHHLTNSSRVIAQLVYGNEEKTGKTVRQIFEKERQAKGKSQISPRILKWLKRNYWLPSRTTDSFERVSSEFFVGREKELDLFKWFLLPDSGSNILNIHTDGVGGIGKTRLLLRMQKYCSFASDHVIFTRELIDFYHVESRSAPGIMHQIVRNLGRENFPQFTERSQEYYEGEDRNVRSALLPMILDVFWGDYSTFAERMKAENRVIVLFFDTYECIQTFEITSKNQEGEEKNFSLWLERHFFPHLTQNSRIVIAGRDPLVHIDRSTLSVTELYLPWFSFSDTKAFWKHCFNISTDRELIEIIGSEELIETFHQLCDGRPVLLSLFADGIIHKKKPLSPEGLLNSIVEQTGDLTLPVTRQQKQIFEKALIYRIVSLPTRGDLAVAIMAVAFHRMTADMLAFLTKRSLEEAKTIFEELKPLSFVKYKYDDIILLHDEVRWLIVQHWWDNQDNSRTIRKGIVQELVKYYEESLLSDENISEAEREIYTSELLDYAFLADPETGVKRFCDEFDLALDDGRYYYCDSLLREAENFHRENSHDIPFPDFLYIDLQKIQYSNRTHRNIQGTLKYIEGILFKYKDTPGWKEHKLRGKFLLEKGVAEFYLESFEASLASFQQARGLFFDIGEDVLSSQVDNWIGYIHYQQGRFSEAEHYMTQSQEGLYQLLTQKREFPAREFRRVLQGLQLSFGNLATVYSYTGRFDTAINIAETSLDIVLNLPRNNMEVARVRALNGRVHLLANNTIDAQRHLSNAETLLQDVNERLLTGRIKTDLGSLQYRVREFPHLIEFYRAEEINQAIQDKYPMDADHSGRILEEGLELLEKEPEFEKELADAYYALGELYMLMPSEDHWERAETAFLKSLEFGRKSGFLYRTIETLVSLITLYYFWNGTSNGVGEVNDQNWMKMLRCQSELDTFNESMMYPKLFGRYEITLGNIEYDKTLKILENKNRENFFEDALRPLETAFNHYINAAELMRTFHEEHYFLILRIMHVRMHNLLNDESKQKLLLTLLTKFRSLWKDSLKEIENIAQTVLLSIEPEKKLEEIKHLSSYIEEQLDRGDFRWALLLNDSLINAYTSLISQETTNDLLREKIILRLNYQSSLYRKLGNNFHSMWCIHLARHKLQSLTDPLLKKALEGYTAVMEGMLTYRRGDYGKSLSFYLKDKLILARYRFDRLFPGNREKALSLMQKGEMKLIEVLSYCEKNLRKEGRTKERKSSERNIFLFRKMLNEAKLRIGELLMINEQFYEDDGSKGALTYLQDAVYDFEKIGDSYYYYDAIQSYIRALYLSGNYDHPDYRAQRTTLEKHLTERLASTNGKIYPLIMGKLRITQGDALFSHYFTSEQASSETYRYIPADSTNEVLILRSMLRSYVEACDFMAQHNSIDFNMVILLLHRRIRLISDKNSLQIILDGLRQIWRQQSYLRDRTDELDSLLQLTTIRIAMLENESIS